MSIHLLVTGAILLLLVAVAMRVISKRFDLPFTVLLVVAGILLSHLAVFAPHPFDHLAHLELSSELFLLIFLPTLIFESAFNLDSRKLKQNLLPVLFLAVPGVLLSTAIIGGLIWWLTPLDGVYALILGALLSATDPVAVIALFKQLGAPKRLTVLVEGESLFNDATAIVLTHILIAVAISGSFGFGDFTSGVSQFFIVFIGGLLVGVVTAWLFGWLIGLVKNDQFIEVPLTVVLAYASFVLAEEMHLSGVMAVVAAGVMMGGWGRTKISPSVSHYLTELWEYFAFLANALIFLLVGLMVDLHALRNSLDLLFWVILAMLVSRLVVVYGLVPVANRLPGAEPIRQNYKHIMYWGGLRGAVALALVLSLPESEFQSTLIALTAGAVLFTLLVQGLTIGPLVHRLKLDHPPIGDRLSAAGVALDSTAKAEDKIPKLHEEAFFSPSIAKQLEKEYQAKKDYWTGQRETLVTAHLSKDQEHTLLYLMGFSIEKQTYYELFAEGNLGESDYHDLIHSVEMQVDYLNTHQSLPKNTLHTLWHERIHQLILHLLEKYLNHTNLLQHFSRDYTARDYIKTWAQFHGSSSVLTEMPERARREGISEESIQEVVSTYQLWHRGAQKRIEGTAEQFPEFVSTMQERRARRLLLLTERKVVSQHIRHGKVSERLGSELLMTIDQDLERLKGYQTEALSVDVDELLAKVSFFQKIPTEKLQEITAYMHLLTVPPNEYIIRQGEAGDSMFFIVRGEVKILREEDGEKKLLATLNAGNFFGEQSLLNHQPRNATCRAGTACALYELKSKDFEKIITAYPTVKEAVDNANRERG